MHVKSEVFVKDGLLYLQNRPGWSRGSCLRRTDQRGRSLECRLRRKDWLGRSPEGGRGLDQTGLYWIDMGVWAVSAFVRDKQVKRTIFELTGYHLIPPNTT